MQNQLRSNGKEQILVQSTASYYEDEISLVDLYLVLIRYRWIAILTFLSIFVLGIIYVAFTKPVYESTAIVEVGQTGQPINEGGGIERSPLEDPQVFVAKLRERSWSVDPKEIDDTLNLSSVSYEKRGANTIITLKTTAGSPEMAHQSLSAIVRLIIQEQLVLFDSVTNPRKELISTFQIRLEEIDKQIKLLNTGIGHTGKVDATQAAILAVEKSRLVGQIPEIEEKISLLKLELSPIYNYPSRIIRKPTIENSPIKPRIKLYIGISILLGIVAGVFVAFLFEFIRNLHSSIAESKVSTHSDGSTNKC